MPILTDIYPSTYTTHTYTYTFLLLFPSSGIPRLARNTLINALRQFALQPLDHIEYVSGKKASDTSGRDSGSMDTVSALVQGAEYAYRALCDGDGDGDLSGGKEEERNKTRSDEEKLEALAGTCVMMA